MDFPKLETVDQAITLGRMMGDRGFTMLIAERELLVRKLVNEGELGNEEMEQQIDLLDAAGAEYVRMSRGVAPTTRTGQDVEKIFKLRPDLTGARR